MNEREKELLAADAKMDQFGAWLAEMAQANPQAWGALRGKLGSGNLLLSATEVLMLYQLGAFAIDTIDGRLLSRDV